MIRSIAAVLAGTVVWGLLWVSVNGIVADMFPELIVEGQRLDYAPILLFYIGFSIILSIFAGYLTALIASRRGIAHTFALGILQLALGIIVTVQYYDLLPLWYHILFLLFLIPGNIFGGYLRVSQVEKARFNLINA